MLHDQHNTLFRLAADFIQYTNRSVFLTGRAGTGKTTFLKYIKANTIKQTAVVAPTGVAAINAGGVTIHSFFQLPFTPFIPEGRGFQQTESSIDKHHLLGRIKMNRERIKVLRELELLIIDEISMVRCDVLDAIDILLRHFRYRYNEPFGGVQVLFIGDMFQLPPVVQDEEWRILSPFYNSPFFFDSKVVQLDVPVHIELNKIYRQNEQAFIQLLNKVRNNEMDAEGFALLNSRFNPSFQPSKDDGFITLTTHNYKADAMNTEALAKLNGKTTDYKAAITGEFNEKSYPAESLLQMKVGAQVMMIKNDTEKRYFNGKIGVVAKLEEETVYVQCRDENEPIEVRKEIWENIRYTLDPSTQKVDEDVAGTFEQFPLRLAWAITIHKSQGLTFEKAVIDAGSAFASGQVYVALSRCTMLNGIVLKSVISNNGLHNDERIVSFSQRKYNQVHLTEELNASKKVHEAALLANIFDFTTLISLIDGFCKTASENREAFNEETFPWIAALQEKAEKLQEITVKFRAQLQTLLVGTSTTEHNEQLQKRVIAGAEYFSQHLGYIVQYISSSPAITDSRQKAAAYNEALQDVHLSAAQKLHAVNGCRQGFNASGFYQHKQQFILPAFMVNAYAAANRSFKTNSPHPELYRQLRVLRDKLCAQKDLPVFMVASGATLDELARYLPQNPGELSQISGFGKAKLESYGQQFLSIITAYCKEHQLVSLIHEKNPKRQRKEKAAAKEKVDTKLESYKLHQQGKSVADIAAHRNLTPDTIAGHLAHYVKNGQIAIEALLSKEIISLIEPVISGEADNQIAVIRNSLGNRVNFGDIRLVIAYAAYKKQHADAGNTAEEPA